MANVCAFNRQEGENIWCRYLVVCHDGVDEELMSKINSNHEEDMDNYSFDYYDNHDLSFLGGYIPPAYTWRLLIVKHITERKHRMDGAPEWVIRNEKGYYYNSYSKVLYAGPNIYDENYKEGEE